MTTLSGQGPGRPITKQQPAIGSGHSNASVSGSMGAATVTDRMTEMSKRMEADESFILCFSGGRGWFRALERRFEMVEKTGVMTASVLKPLLFFLGGETNLKSLRDVFLSSLLFADGFGEEGE